VVRGRYGRRYDPSDSVVVVHRATDVTERTDGGVDAVEHSRGLQVVTVTSSAASIAHVTLAFAIALHILRLDEHHLMPRVQAA